MFENENIHTRTEKFHQDTIEATVEGLAWHFSENGLSEDLSDRIKAAWEKNLREAQAKNLEEAQRKMAERAKTAQ
jgi:hypothetical protein